MTDAHDPEIDALDRAARTASEGLHTHVARHVDPEVLLSTLPAGAPRANRGRLLAAAAVAALFIGSVAVLGDGPGEGGDSRLELDQDGERLPAPQPGTLTPLGPNDGRDSIQLPVTVEPSAGLRDGQTVSVAGTGFVAGERVGIVQCAREAGGEVREDRAGVDGCNIGTVTYANADQDGRAEGSFKVRRVLTTPATGTVDCASEPERCSIGMGALDDYDRSGGLALVFTGGGEPVDIPSVRVSPAEGLADGDVVHVEGEGFAPGPVTLNVCAIDPKGCWSTGEPVEVDADEAREMGVADGEEIGSWSFTGLLAGDDGRISGDVPLWRFLPAEDPTSYIDCAVSECRLRLTAEQGTSPPPVALSFTSGGQGPTPPAIAASPTRDLRPGDEIVVRGAGFEPDDFYSVSLCVAPARDPSFNVACDSSGPGDARIDGQGSFAQLFEVPDLREMDVTATTSCSSEGQCSDPIPPEQVCDGANTVCTIRVDVYSEAMSLRPQFPAAPVEVTFRR